MATKYIHNVSGIISMAKNSYEEAFHATTVSTHKIYSKILNPHPLFQTVINLQQHWNLQKLSAT